MTPADLFGDDPADAPAPGPAQRAPGAGAGPRTLADRLRPTALAEVAGQRHLLADGAPLAEMARAASLPSLVLWGPPGVGKTTLARLLADAVDLAFVQVSAVFTSVAELRRVFAAAEARHAQGRGTLLFVDEIHRLNKAQQDGFLPHMETGVLTLIGATTENPSFELNAALLSRAQVLVLHRLDAEALEALLARVEAAEGPLPLAPDARAAMIAMADGDGRALLNLAEQALRMGPGPVDAPALARRLTRRAALYDKGGDAHYDLISALHKAVRGSDPDAALYWLARMIEGGEDPRFLARRLVRMASEDVGLADPDALALAIHAWESYERLGSPEGELALAEAAVHLALAPKSNAVYRAWGAAKRLAAETGSARPPDTIVNAPTKLMREIGRGAGYEYDHDAEDGFSGQDYFPEGVARRALYRPVERGFERDLAKRVAWFERLRERRRAARGEEGAAPLPEGPHDPEGDGG